MAFMGALPYWHVELLPEMKWFCLLACAIMFCAGEAVDLTKQIINFRYLRRWGYSLYRKIRPYQGHADLTALEIELFHRCSLCRSEMDHLMLEHIDVNFPGMHTSFAICPTCADRVVSKPGLLELGWWTSGAPG